MSLHKEILGVTIEDNKTKFSVYSKHADKIELCLFSDDEKTENKILLTKNEDTNIWSVELDDISAGQKYGYRAHGKYNPSEGVVFNPNKLLVDPYAKDLSNSIEDWENPALLVTNDMDSAHLIPKSVVVFDNAEEDAEKYPYLHKKPQTSWEDTIIYEAHVKGFTAQAHVDEDQKETESLTAIDELLQDIRLPEEIRGKFLGLAHPATIAYLKDLGITHLELMPVTTTCGGIQLEKSKGLSDYWGYNPINHFALDKRFGSRDDFKYMVSKLHEAGIEVGLDVVYNHTGEFELLSNSISYKGLDSPSYYRMSEHNKSEYINTTGCGNSFNVNSAPARKVLEDSLVYFAKDLGIDGFRFDLGGDCALGHNHQFDDNGAFIATVRKIKHHYGVKTSGEAWSALGGYYHGHMRGMTEWNDKHEKTIRRFFKGEHGVASELAGHVSGGEGTYYGERRSKYINYTSVHDGMSLYDVVNYNEKNNWKNNENNRDGTDQNHSSISPNEDIAFRRMKSMLATNILSRGVPLLLSGDEVAKTQQGNNNTYCHDNELSWHKWDNLDDKKRDLYMFTRKLIAFRKSHPMLSSLDKFTGETVESNGRKDIEWVRPDGREMSSEDWGGHARTLAYIVNGEGATVSPNKDSHHKKDDDFFVVMSGNVDNEVAYTLPKAPNNGQWRLVFDTSYETDGKTAFFAGGEYKINPYSVAVFVAENNTTKNLEKTINQVSFFQQRQRSEYASY